MQYQGQEIPPLRLVKDVNFAKVGDQSFAVLNYGITHPPILIPAEQARALFDSMGYYYWAPRLIEYLKNLSLKNPHSETEITFP